MEPFTDDTLTFRRGATFRKRYTFALPTATEENDWTPRRDFTDCEARMEVRVKPGAPLLISVSEEESTEGQITLGGTEGTIDVWLTPDGTRDLPNKETTVQWDLFVEWPGGDTFCVGQGTAVVDPNITEPTND